MAKLKDSTGRHWELSIPNFATVAKLRQTTGLDLNKIGNGEVFDVFFCDAEALIKAVWTLLEKRSEDTYDAFIEVIDAETLDAIRKAAIEAILDFFHQSRSATLKSRVAEMIGKLGDLSGSSNSASSLPASSA